MNTVADRFFYLPAIGVSIAFSALPTVLSRRRLRVLSAAAAVLLALLAALSFRLLPLWSSSLSLYRHAARTFPGHPANAELARHAIDSSGDFPAAAALLRTVLERDPALCSARFLYADCLLHDDSPAAAARFLLDAPPPQDLANAAVLYSRLARYAYFDGDYASALRYARQALPLLPANSTSRTVELFLCVAAAFDSGDLPLALSFARQTPAFANLGAVSVEHLLPCAIFLWVDSCRKQAAALFLRILDACSSRADIANNILWGFATANWSPVPSSVVLERARHMRAAAPFPDHPAILDTLAAALANDGDFDSAVAALDRALPQVPPSPFRDSLLERRALYLSRQPCRDNGFERLFSATLGPAANAL
jgi:tetratricopeptide (TPR) repeat protein